MLNFKLILEKLNDSETSEYKVIWTTEVRNKILNPKESLYTVKKIIPNEYIILKLTSKELDQIKKDIPSIKFKK